MRVVRAVRFGGPEVLEPGSAPDPEAGTGQVVVAVAVAALDFVQTQIRRGFTPGPPLPEPPYVPGSSIAGEVVSVGAGVDPGWVGRRVVGHTAGGWGASAELAVAAVDGLVEVPADVELTRAAALQDDGATGLGLIELADVRAGEWVLVLAAAGGLGGVLVQLARAAGARVVGAARGKEKLDLAAESGASAVVDYSEPGWTDQVRAATDGRGPDLVFDGVGGEIGRAAFGVTARGGRYSVHGAASGAPTVVAPEEAAERGVRVLGIQQLYGLREGKPERVARILADSRVQPHIGQAVPLAEAAAAHAAMEARTVLGKSLLLTR